MWTSLTALPGHYWTRYRRNGLEISFQPRWSRVRASQLQQCLVTGREPAEATIQATLDLIYLGQGPAGSTTLADKVSTVSHTLDVQPSTTVSAQIDSRRKSLSPTKRAETTGGSLYTAIANSGNIYPTRDSIPGYVPSQPQH